MNGAKVSLEMNCGDCKFSGKAIDPANMPGMWECLRYPPQLHVIPIPQKIVGAPPQLMKQSGFPNCAIPCGEFVFRGQANILKGENTNEQ